MNTLKVSVVYSPAARHVREWLIDLPEGSPVSLALERCWVFNEFPALRMATLELGIWGQRIGLSQELKANDRIEIYRSLRVDPKVARRERFNRQGIKRAGLFSSTREGGKAGY